MADPHSTLDRAYVEANRNVIESPGEIARFRERAEAMQAWNVVRLLDSHEALRAEFATWHRALRTEIEVDTEAQCEECGAYYPHHLKRNCKGEHVAPVR